VPVVLLALELAIATGDDNATFRSRASGLFTTISEVNDMGTPMHENHSERPNSELNWVKSSLSFSNGNCVEVASLADGGVGVRNSRDAGGSVLAFTPDEWHAFLGGVRNGEFDSFGR
jgi:uncharacterized protein DUF397